MDADASTYGLTASAIARWQGHDRIYRVAAADVARQSARDAQRTLVLPEIRSLLAGFASGQVALELFRHTLDSKVRSAWDLFGLKGRSGTLFLNQMVKFLGGKLEFSVVLRAALAVPNHDREARAQMQELADYLQIQLDAGKVSAKEVQIRRVPFFVSACWHIQRPERWPAFYQSSVRSMQADGVLAAIWRSPTAIWPSCV